MKIILSIIMLLLASPSWAAYSFVASAQARSTNLNNVTTSGIDTTGANLIVVSATSFPIGTLTDSKSNSWTKLTTYSNGTVSVATAIFYCYAPTVGSGHTFTFTQASGAPSISVIAFSGAVASPADKDNGNTSFNSTTSVSTGSITPAENNELIVSGLGGGATSGTWTANESMTNVGYLPTVSGQGYGTAIAYKMQTTAAAINPTWSSGVSGSGAVAIASFKAAPDAGGALFILGDDF